MNLLDREVYAVLTALVLVASVLTASEVLKTAPQEHYASIGLLNNECAIGEYPEQVNNGDNLTLCLYIGNNLGYPALFQVKYKIGNENDLPTNNSPSQAIEYLNFLFYIDNGDNITHKVNVPIMMKNMKTPSQRVALIFELWYLNPDNGTFVYSGDWVSLYITVKRPALGGG